jgi:hypothetical protein
MKSKLSIVLAMCALMLGLSATGAAQVTKHRTRDGRIVYQTQRRDETRDYRRNDRRSDGRWDNQRNDRRYNDRDDYRRNNGRYNQDWRRQNQQQTYGAQTYRLPNGRLVTILPDGRRIYH